MSRTNHARREFYEPWRDWKGDLVPSIAMMFGAVPRVTIPPEFADEPALLAHLGMSLNELKKIWWYRHKMYHDFNIAKGSGKIRIISAPDERLKYLQRKIAELLSPMYRVRNPVHGFVIGKSVLTNATSHLGGRFLLNLDLKDFFPTITENRVEGIFRSLGISRRVSEILARICCNNSRLPQGAPSSPLISNMICFRMDKELLAVAKAARCIYTRYADDMSFSSYRPLSTLFEVALPPSGNFSPELLSADLKSAIEGNGFLINPEKAHYADRHSRRTVTGVRINEGLNVDRQFVRNLRAAIYSVEKLGPSEAQAKYKEKYGGTASVASHLRGKLVWLRGVKGQADPVFRRLAKRYNDCYPDDVIAFEPTVAERRHRAVWLVEHDKNAGIQGTAFFLKGVGLVTAAHCVDDPIDLVVYHPSRPSNKCPVTIAKFCEVRDLAILTHTIPASDFYELEVADQSLNDEDSVISVGYPDFGPGDKLTVRPGVVSSLPKKNGVQKIETNINISPGMSGGPLLNAENQLVGINHKGGPDEDRDLAIHLDELLTFAAE